MGFFIALPKTAPTYCTIAIFAFPLPQMKAYQDLKELVDSMDKDVQKFYQKGNKEAAIRLRHKLRDIRNMAQQLRMDILKLSKKKI